MIGESMDQNVFALPTTRLSRAGELWEDHDYEGLIAGVRGRQPVDSIAHDLGRSVNAVRARLRYLLPVEVRACPADRVYAAAEQAFADEAYDWRKTILESPPPAPVVRPAPIERRGFAGLDAEELGIVAFALAQVGGSDCADALSRVCEALEEQPLSLDIAVGHAGRWLRRRGHLLDCPYDVDLAGYNWLANADGWRTPRTSSRFAATYDYGWEPSYAAPRDRDSWQP